MYAEPDGLIDTEDTSIYLKEIHGALRNVKWAGLAHMVNFLGENKYYPRVISVRQGIVLSFARTARKDKGNCSEEV